MEKGISHSALTQAGRPVTRETEKERLTYACNSLS